MGYLGTGHPSNVTQNDTEWAEGAESTQHRRVSCTGPGQRLSRSGGDATRPALQRSITRARAAPKGRQLWRPRSFSPLPSTLHSLHPAAVCNSGHLPPSSARTPPVRSTASTSLVCSLGRVLSPASFCAKDK